MLHAASTPDPLPRVLETTLIHWLHALIDQHAARIIVPPYGNSTGFWFGGGNAVRAADGTIWLVGRYRNFGDSRTGTGAGERGLELALFASADGGQTFEKRKHWTKADLSRPGAEVVSIEGAALHLPPGGGVELYVSTEKAVPYPEPVRSFQKPGTGVWSIDRMHAADFDGFKAASLAPVFDTEPPLGYLHVKDPVVFDWDNGDTVLIFCDHPYTWASANSGYAVRPGGAEAFELKSWELIARGPAWDVAGTRITNRLPVPRVGAFKDVPPLSIYFFDGLECYRSHDENPNAVSRHRGYSCEEFCGAGYGFDAAFPRMTRLSQDRPRFTSPHGTGCSRYIDTLTTPETLLATWQQSQPDHSQPLVAHALAVDAVARMLE